LVSSFAIECSVVALVQHNSWANVISKDLILAMQYFANALKEGKIVDSFDSNNNLLTNVDNLSWYAERLEKIIEVLNNQTSEYDEEKAYQRICKAFSNE
jgi:allophanate hydrolase subunit 1